MRDRYSGNGCVDNMLEKWKTEVAKVSVSGFEKINESAKKIYTSINEINLDVTYTLY